MRFFRKVSQGVSFSASPKQPQSSTGMTVALRKVKHRKEGHRRQRKDRDQADADLEEQHAAHHQLGSAQPDREGHRGRFEPLQSVDREVLVHLQGRAPRVHDLRETRENEGCRKNDPAEIGQQFEDSVLSHRVDRVGRTGASAAPILSKIASGEAMVPVSSLQSMTRSCGSEAAASR